MSFHVGQKIECIKLTFNPAWRGKRRPVVGRIYTVRDVGVRHQGGVDCEGVWLDEIINPLHPSGHEYGFFAACFRPVVERKTDISIFTAMLTPKKAKVEA